MTDLTPDFIEALKSHNVSSIANPHEALRRIDEFLKEAYRINSHIASLHAYLRSIRHPYLSTTPPPHRNHLTSHPSSSRLEKEARDRKYLTDAQRDQIDAESKQLLRELNAAIRNLADAEKVRQDTENAIASRKRARNYFGGTIGRWAAGGAMLAKTPEEELDEARRNVVNAHRESVLWYLRRKLEECGELQREMMEARLTREMEKRKSVLYEARQDVRTQIQATSAKADGYVGGKAAQMDEETRREIEGQLSEEQLQLFAKENQNMLKHYEDTLDQVRTAERSLLEISELQTTLANNLAIQSAHIDQLVTDAELTTENVGGGNKELKRATERKSTAKYVFYASCCFSLFLITWDLLI